MNLGYALSAVKSSRVSEQGEAMSRISTRRAKVRRMRSRGSFAWVPANPWAGRGQLRGCSASTAGAVRAGSSIHAVKSGVQSVTPRYSYACAGLGDGGAASGTRSADRQPRAALGPAPD